MLLKEIKTLFHKELDDIYPKTEVDSFFSLFLEHYLKLERFILALQPEYVLSKSEEQPFFEGLARLKLEEPVQYILGKAYFRDIELRVNKHVLIPRPETEELVEWVIGELKTQNSEFNILDIGTGSGCIAISLSKAFPNAQVFAMDISKGALEVARQNARTNQVDIHFMEADILNPELTLDHKFEIIVSNPPYVRELEKVEMRDNVTKYEPHRALFVSDKDPLLFYRAIVQFAKKQLKPRGGLFLEINQYLSSESKKLMLENDFGQVELRKDIFGNFRMLKVVGP
ncbi:peptide chain release factor N(5)-glutamine methyltransferase [Muricauda sp. SCSIO 64092]|uniref:peptide chain release factor N(5)-glutamine methyltransferase n=1 Tax=Allomuricauda sp. SCSIO 64092 TaxID=2908842 RepID=UPI001FF381D9|nr:peptide chain release factor N(5)-glutamine methyltransferase [Muricauda sp. SCSIO 64092]UOY06942.1 peptide chain release factor N(5)-glutamine methyltransferase [Muricauda sp. SCSIO 64092]